MDKYEYKVRADEIKDLISRGEYVQAAEIADTIDWRRVKSVMMLCTISDLYKINRRYEDARDMLLLAYERRPGGRTICYSLCELSIKMEEFVEAVEYYKEFVQVAPKDSGRYILQYKLYEAQDVSLEERIAVLEELKKRDYREKWAYELAYLYHRIGLAARCVEECDELILWFGEGKYVIKAMELKMLHQPLSAEQQEKYDNRFVVPAEEPAEKSTSRSGEEATVEQPVADTIVYQPVEGTPAVEEMEIQVNVGEYNTINLQEELAAGLKEVLAREHQPVIEDPITRSIVAPMLENDTESLDYPEIDEVSEDDLESDVEEMEASEVFFGETGELAAMETYTEDSVTEEALEEDSSAKDSYAEEPYADMGRLPVGEAAEEFVTLGDIASPVKEWHTEEIVEILPEDATGEAVQTVPDVTAEIVMSQLRQEIRTEDREEEKDAKESERLLRAEPPKALAGVLSQESDGQIRLVMPEHESIEKQITGQMSIDDILAEWERMKKENQEKREEETRQYVLQQTGAMFTEFEAAVRDGLLEQLEREKPEEDGNVAETEEILEETVEVEEVAEETFGADVEEMSEEDTEEVSGAVVEGMSEADDEAISETVAEEMPEADEEVSETAAEEVLETGTTEVPEAVTEEAVEGPAEEAEDAAADDYDITEADEVEELEEIAEEQSAEEEVSEEVPEEVSEADKTQGEDSSQEETFEKPRLRSLTREEKELFAPYIHSKSAREQLVKVIDNISLAAYTGNVIVTGDEGMDTMTLAKNLIRELQVTDHNFSGKVAKVSGSSLNKKDVEETLDKLQNGALIIFGASQMNSDTAQALHKALQKEAVGIVIVLEDVRKAMDRFLAENEILKSCFTARMDVEALSNDALVAYGKRYAREREYSIDDFGVLALHTKIEELQTIDHAVTITEVQEMVDAAIQHANRKTLGHFFDVLFARRYDEEDMIILGEKDFT